MEEQNTSMEELKVEEDENIKDVSLEEDILGTQTLLMSESEDENEGNGRTAKSTSISPLKQISPKTITPNLEGNGNEVIKIDNENNSLTRQVTETSLEYDDAQRVGPRRSKRILDSDDEDAQNTKYSDETVDDTKNSKAKKISKLIDSDSETDEDCLKRDSEDGEWANNCTDEMDTEKVLKVKKSSKSIADSDLEQIYERKISLPQSDMELEVSKQKISTLIDSESETESEKNANGSDGEAELEESARAASLENSSMENKNQKANSKQKSKILRASAKKAMDEMQAIQSEQQRLHREANISIPYHKPKKHTLHDFLNRRTIIKPMQGNSSIADAVPKKSLKMTQEELEEYAKLMEERANEAKEFFKSESEDEEIEDSRDNTGVLETISAESELAFNDNQKHEQLDLPSRKEEKEEPNLVGVNLTEEELAAILAEDVRQQWTEDRDEPRSSKALITEVIELPKLDMNTIIMNPVKQPKRKIDVKKLLSTIKISGKPYLSGDPNKLIDLETGGLIEKTSTGVENLMKRLMATVKARKSNNSEACNILSTENGKLEMTTVNVSIKEEKDPNKEPKPGAAYFELQKNLKEIIKKKRLEDLHKKQEDEFENSKCLESEDEDEDEAEEHEHESESKKLKIVEIDEEENPVYLDDIEKEHTEENENNLLASDIEEQSDLEEEDCGENREENSEDEPDDVNDNCGSNDCSSDKESICSNKRKTRIIKAFEDSDEEADTNAIDFFNPVQPSSQSNIFHTQASEKNVEVEENELIDLCSGNFNATQALPLNNALMSQIPITQNQGKSVDDDVLMGLCSGTFDNAAENSSLSPQNTYCEIDEGRLQAKGHRILSSGEDEQEDQGANKRKKFTKKIKKRRNAGKLEFSDDEEEDWPKAIEVADDDEESLEAAEEEPETFIDYDSEENEVVVQMTKKEFVKRAENFFENEAVLSESEWGSADEDEQNLDTYDIELGDEDEFDKEKLRTELEQIHTRKMLDEDLREVRIIQDMLFEDEEKDGVGRQRQFKWKNTENGFSLEDSNREENGEGAICDSGDELNEHQWRKIRYEREQFLKDQGLKPGSQDTSTTLSNTASFLENCTISKNSVKKIQIITAKKTAASSSGVSSEKSNPFLITKGVAAMHKKSVRGSFLVRDKETLSKLAGFTKGTAGSANATNINDAAGTVSIKGVKAQNFVFATLTEEEHQNLKRKSDDLLNSSNENGTNFMKKPKIEPRRDKCFIDQLL